MRKGFTRKPQGDEPATRGKNYITRSGLQRLKDEHRFLLSPLFPFLCLAACVLGVYEREYLKIPQIVASFTNDRIQPNLNSATMVDLVATETKQPGRDKRKKVRLGLL